MVFDPCNRALKIQKSIGIRTPKVELLTFSCTHGSMKCDSRVHSWPAPLQALALVRSPRLKLWHPSSLLAHTFANLYLGHEPKAGVVTPNVHLCSIEICPLGFHQSFNEAPFLLYNQMTREERGLKQCFIYHWAFFCEWTSFRNWVSPTFGHNLFNSLTL
jgi:hypothetical protein